MRNKTKYLLDSKAVRKLCETAVYKDISKIKPLSSGEFNAVYCAAANVKAIAVKIVLPSSNYVMTHEKDMIRTELYRTAFKELKNIKIDTETLND